MMRHRLVMFLAALGLGGAGLAVLVAAKDPSGKDKEAVTAPATAPVPQLVTIGLVDTVDPMIEIYPANFPSPSMVTKVLVREGEEVKKGQILLELDNDVLVSQVAAAEERIKAAEAEVEAAQALVDAHKPLINAQLKELESRQERVKFQKEQLKNLKAHLNSSKTPADILDKENEIRVAEQEMEAAEIKLKGLRDNPPTPKVAVAQRAVKLAKVMKEQAELALKKQTCKAEEDGRIIRSFAVAGTLFAPASRKPAFWFLKKGPLIVRTEVSQEFAQRIKEGAKADIEDDADSKQKWTGTVTKVPDYFLQKRSGNGMGLDSVPGADDRFLECQVSINVEAGKAAPRYGQKVRVSIPQ